MALWATIMTYKLRNQERRIEEGKKRSKNLETQNIILNKLLLDFKQKLSRYGEGQTKETQEEESDNGN
jgi:hypothetical protein